MFRDITLGQYYPSDSAVHRLDPRTKLGMTLLYIVMLFVVDNLLGYVLCAVWILGWIALSKISLGYMLRGLRVVVFLMALSVVFNLFLTKGEVIWSWRSLSITREGVRQAVKMAARITMLILGSSLLTFTTRPMELTAGLEQGLGFLKKVGVPVHEIAMMMSIALRFLPILTEETDRIRKAQMARGADFDSGSLMQRAKAMVPLLVPLILSAFRRAGDLTTAMEARCYHGGEGRTRMKPLHYRKADAWAWIATAVFTAAAILIRCLENAA